jgi:hypothetical protein
MRNKFTFRGCQHIIWTGPKNRLLVKIPHFLAYHYETWLKSEPCSRVAWHRPSIRGEQIIRFARMTETELKLKLQ